MNNHCPARHNPKPSISFSSQFTGPDHSGIRPGSTAKFPQSKLIKFASFCLVFVALGCQSSPSHKPNSQAQKTVKLEKVEKLEAPAAKISSTQKFTIQTDGADIGFTMDAPLEKIRGRIPNTAVEGYLHLDPSELASTTGIIKVNLSELELFQRKSDSDGAEFGEESKSELQNEHAKAWLEIDGDAPAEERSKNQSVEFSIQSISNLNEGNVQKLSGPERKVTFIAQGDFLLHQHKSPQTVKMQAVLHYKGDTLDSISVSTVDSFPVSLENHDVRPRETFGKLAQKTLAAMSPKVAQVADVHVKFSAKVQAAEKTAKLQ